MTQDEFITDAKRRIIEAGYTVGYVHEYASDPGLVYVASFEAARGCYGQPMAEAQRWPNGMTQYSANLR